MEYASLTSARALVLCSRAAFIFTPTYRLLAPAEIVGAKNPLLDDATMKMYLRAFLAALSLLVAIPAHADIIYDWSGQCWVGCNGTATGVLTLDDAFNGLPGDQSRFFLSWEFTSDTSSYLVQASTPAQYQFDWFLNGFELREPGRTLFLTDAPFLTWLSGVPIPGLNPAGEVDMVSGGIVGPISGSVSAPTSLALLGAGLLVIGLGRRRNVR